MNMKPGYFLLLIGNVLILNMATASSMDYRTIIVSIGHDIAELKTSFPQLEEFSADKHVHSDKLQIVYQYKTHEAKNQAGWAGSVPNPDSDGVWFYIDVHEATSSAQIHTQPFIAPICLNDKKVSLLILEGEDTKSIRESIWHILENYGVERCE